MSDEWVGERERRALSGESGARDERVGERERRALSGVSGARDERVGELETRTLSVQVRSAIRRIAAARRRDEHSGSVTPFVLIVTIALLMLAGLVIDGGRQLNSRSRAFAYAQEAARAGAQTIDLTKDQALLDGEDALEAASRFCAQAMEEDGDLVECVPRMLGSKDPSGTRVLNVKVNTTVETDGIMSGMFGVNTWTADGRAIARPIQGTTEAQTGQEQTLPPPDTAPPTGNPFPTATGPPPTDPIPPCPSPYVDPYHPRQTWEPGDKPLKPPPTYRPNDPPSCWPPWEPPTKDPPDNPNDPPDNPNDPPDDPNDPPDNPKDPPGGNGNRPRR